MVSLRLFAHRGGAKLWPENTLRAFRGAIALGIYHLELDLHLSADGKLVVIHDSTVDRTSDGRGPVNQKSWDELQALDAAFRFQQNGEFVFRNQGDRFPCLESVMELHPEVRVNADLKAMDFEAARRLAEVIQKRQWQERIVVASEHHEVLSCFRKQSRGEVQTSASRQEITRFCLAGWSGLPLKFFDRKPAYQYLQVPRRYRGLPIVNRRTIKKAHAVGVGVHVWTIDDPVEMGELISLGVDGLMSDRPDLFAQL